MSSPAKRLPLHREHEAANAVFAVDRGWLLPDHYGDPADEEHTLTRAVGLVDRSQLSIVDVVGRDRVSFLQGLLSNDVSGVPPGRGCKAALLNVKARVQMLMTVLVFDDRVRLVLPANEAQTLIAKLDRFIILEDVELHDRSGQLVVLSVLGPRWRDVAARAAESSPDELRALMRWPRELHHEKVTIDGAEVLAVCTGQLGVRGLQLFSEVHGGSKLWRTLVRIGADYGLGLVGHRAADACRIEAGIPVFGVDVDEQTFLPDLPLDDLVSFTKGCYLGQEPVARVHHRGRAARALTGFVLSQGTNLPPSGSAVYSGDNEVGWITSAAFSNHLAKPIAMGFLRREYFEPGTELTIRIDRQQVRAEVTPLPIEPKPPQETT